MESIVFPLPQRPHKIPIGPNRTAPQQPFPAEKSFPEEVVSVVTCKFGFPHLGHCIFKSPLYLIFNSIVLCFYNRIKKKNLPNSFFLHFFLTASHAAVPHGPSHSFPYKSVPTPEPPDIPFPPDSSTADPMPVP